MSQATDLLKRYLRHREEMGDREIFLDRFTAHEISELLAAGTVRDASPAAADASAPAAIPGASAADLMQIGDLEKLRGIALGCPRCRLAETRRHVVFGEGSPRAEVMVVGEGPGADEDRTGRPFVGRAGQMLNLLLASAGFEREAVYICNVIKCRPPGNRNPKPDEVASCSPYLFRQADLVQPRVILACGTFAAQTLLETSVSIGKLRGGSHRFRGIPLVATYHPAALLRNAAWTRLAWDDLQRLRGIIGSGTESG